MRLSTVKTYGSMLAEIAMFPDRIMPHAYAESVFALDYSKIKNLGYEAIIFDLDNTLVPHGHDSNEEVDELFRHIHEVGLKTILFTDNDRERVERFKRNIDTPYVCDAEKPNTRAVYKALWKLGLNKKKVLYIGDQMFTDIICANRAGVDCVLVKFIQLPGETGIGKKRQIEKAVLKYYHNNPAMNGRLGDIYLD